MSMDYIGYEVQRLKQRYHETDPFKLCAAMHILVLFLPMGTYEGACKGFFLVQSKKEQSPSTVTYHVRCNESLLHTNWDMPSCTEKLWG